MSCAVNGPCSAYGMPMVNTGYPLPYSQYPEYNASYYQNNADMDLYNNLVNQNLQQQYQLNANVLMPASWNSVSAAQSMSAAPDKCSWTRYTLTTDGAQRNISSAGLSRFGSIDRPSNGRLFGRPNLLRTQPPPALTAGSIGGWFNGSELRDGIVDVRSRPFIGCGN